ncbi:hypothetical protein RRG08_063228 [Elysia crispata]|uniref:Transglutaminase-like domain-containing protein n=1 Tax=Elysia crispata TaxID=231223 RepID=A0AAE1CV09_9GAST|nr:hypothetical protein RRG08_063228 [Elysia crispata]
MGSTFTVRLCSHWCKASPKTSSSETSRGRRNRVRDVGRVAHQPSPLPGDRRRRTAADRPVGQRKEREIIYRNYRVGVIGCVKGHNLKISVFPPPTVYVGKWEFSVEVVKWEFSVEVVKKSESTADVYTYEHDGPIYILFNPWCKDDSVYLGDDELLKEYCLSETGRIYCGSCRNITSRPWNYGQFESSILDCALYLLDVGDSVGIVEQYWENNKSVKYGQCWVFSGVSTTVCCALGIPARSVTNFASAHDTDGSVTIDIMFDESGERDDYMTDDFIWNFHVWNEAWMARPDLAKGFGGWQAFDATPQELSNGESRSHSPHREINTNH